MSTKEAKANQEAEEGEKPESLKKFNFTREGRVIEAHTRKEAEKLLKEAEVTKEVA